MCYGYCVQWHPEWLRGPDKLPDSSDITPQYCKTRLEGRSEPYTVEKRESLGDTCSKLGEEEVSATLWGKAVGALLLLIPHKTESCWLERRSFSPPRARESLQSSWWRICNLPAPEWALPTDSSQARLAHRQIFCHLTPNKSLLRARFLTGSFHHCFQIPSPFFAAWRRMAVWVISRGVNVSSAASSFPAFGCDGNETKPVLPTITSFSCFL